jgi:putative membrane protein
MRTLHLSVLIVACTSTFMLSACRIQSDSSDVIARKSARVTSSSTDHASATASAGPEMAPAAVRPILDERAALGIVNVINDFEIAAGQQALAKYVGGDVAEYAQMMIDQHTRSRTMTNALDPDGYTAEADAKREALKRELDALDSTAEDDYARTYISAMVKGHADALAALDATLIPSATRAEVKEHLTATRKRVARNLEEAKVLEAKHP